MLTRKSKLFLKTLWFRSCLALATFNYFQSTLFKLKLAVTFTEKLNLVKALFAAKTKGAIMRPYVGLMCRQLVVELGVALNSRQHFGGHAGWVAALALPAFNGINTGAKRFG